MRSLCSPSLLLLYCFLVGSLAQTDYDEESSNGDESAAAHTNETLTSSIACPRSFPGEKRNFNNTTYLCIGKGSREHLFSWVSTSLVPSLYTLVLLVGLPANGLALWVLTTKIQRLPSTIFLMNLAVADLLLVLVLPFKISYYFLGHHWLFGEGLCRVVTALFYGNMYCSMLLLACISADRYLAIVHPFFSRSVRSPAFAAGLCALVWLVAASLTLPLTARRQSYPLHGSDGLILCHDVLPQDEQAGHFLKIFVCLVLLGFVLPLLGILFCYGSVIHVLVAGGERYGYAVKLTVLVLASAVALFTPSNVLLLIHYSDPSAKGFGDLYFWYVLSLAVSTFNSCVDPFIYYYVSEEFRDKVKRKFCQQDKRTLTVQKASREDVPWVGYPLYVSGLEMDPAPQRIWPEGVRLRRPLRPPSVSAPVESSSLPSRFSMIPTFTGASANFGKMRGDWHGGFCTPPPCFHFIEGTFVLMTQPYFQGGRICCSLLDKY